MTDVVDDKITYPFTDKQAKEWFEDCKKHYRAGWTTFRELAEKGGVPIKHIYPFKGYLIDHGWSFEDKKVKK